MHKFFRSAKSLCDPGFFFPSANVFNFMQGANTVATTIAVSNLLYSFLFLTGKSVFGELPEHSKTKLFATKVLTYLEDTTPTKNPVTKIVRLAARELSNPLRVTAYCALAVSAFLLGNPSGHTLFPGLAGLFFGIGNLIQSSSKMTAFRNSPQAGLCKKALVHPAVWYGFGYAMTAIGIGGGMSLIVNPLSNPLATMLTLVGVAETTGALGLMASGKVKNQAAPFVGVALGTAIFATAGLVTGNLLGAATGAFACAGETKLAIIMQRIHNQNRDPEGEKSSRIERALTAPLRWAMNRGLISKTP